ncbi:MAG TPA: DM13 domain-containing protein [Thermoleophilaceae bacterium]|jgi:hypothetical protein
MRRALPHAALLLVGLLLVAGCGGGDGDGESKADRNSVPQSRVNRAFGSALPGSRGRARYIAPHWERVAELSGSGESTESFQIKREAVQWRARWRCEGEGRLEVEFPSRPGQPGRSASACPGSGLGSSIQTGDVELKVKAPGEWRITIEQQLHDTIRDPLPPAVADGSARTLGQGNLYPIDNRGKGAAMLYQLPNGRLMVRLEGFSTLATTGLYLWVTEAAHPRTTKEAFHSKHRTVAELRSTAGDQNYLLPRGIRPERIRSIVIWCDPLRIAYLGATLRRP